MELFENGIGIDIDKLVDYVFENLPEYVSKSTLRKIFDLETEYMVEIGLIIELE